MGDTDIMLGSTIFPFFLISDGRLAVFDTDLENAVYFNSADIVSYYMHRFYDMLSRSDYLGDSFDSGFDAMQFLSSCFSGFGNKKYDYYILANVPCIVNDVSHNTILKYANETDGKEGLGAKFGEIINAISNISETTTDIFSYYGMVDYLDLDEWYEYGKHLSKSIDKQLRRDMLDHLLYFSEDERSLNSLMLRLPGFNTNSLVGINFWTNGLIVILYDFPEKPVVIVLNDKSMVASYISYINEMKKCELISTKERSAELIMEELNKRK